MANERSEAGSGVRISVVNAVLMGLSVLLAVGLIVTGGLIKQSNDALREATDRYIVCEQAAADLKAASDYLTMQSRLFVVTEDEVHLENYFTEEGTTRRREHAAEVVEQLLQDDEARRLLDQALAESEELTHTEYYAMKLAAVAAKLDVADQYDELASIELTPTDAALSSVQKRAKAERFLFSAAYQDAKDSIDERIAECMSTLIEETEAEEDKATERLEAWSSQQAIMTVVLVLTLLGSIVSVSVLVLRPLSSYVQAIKRNEPLETVGSAELRAVTQAYNVMYAEARHYEDHLIRQAERDSLTDLLNRNVFDQAYEEASDRCALLLCDVDNFKHINDDFGHDVGDRALKKAADTLVASFRATDRCFRVGGDEFAVLMSDATSEMREVVEAKYRAIQSALAQAGDGMPPITISVGVAFKGELPDGMNLYKAADLALYRAKDLGRDTLCFFEGE